MKRTLEEAFPSNQEEICGGNSPTVDCVCYQVSKCLRLETKGPDFTNINTSVQPSPLHFTVNFQTGATLDAKPRSMSPPAVNVSMTSPIKWAEQSKEVLETRKVNVKNDMWTVDQEQHLYLRNKELVQHHKRQSTVNPRLPSAYVAKHRATCSEWLHDVAEVEKLSSQTLHMSMSLMDRFLSQVPTFQKSKYQLLAATCFLVCAKREEAEEDVPSISEFCTMCDNQFTKQEFIQMEAFLLNTLEWDIAECTPLHFLNFYVEKGISAEEASISDAPRILEYAGLLIDLQLHDRNALQAYVPSIIAASAVATARVIVGLSLWNPELSAVTSYSLNDIQECSQVLYSYYCELCKDEGQT